MALIDRLPKGLKDFVSHTAETLERWLDAIALRLAPAMPWLFLLMRRAALASLFWVAALVLFMGVPQSREVLRGLVLGEVASGSALIAYLFSSMVMALGLWYAARLLVTVDAEPARPALWSTEPALLRLRTATTWLPRALGSSALAVAMGAWMFALLMPPRGRGESLLVVALALCGPLIVARVLALQMPVPRWQRVAGTSVGLLLWAGASWRAATWIEPQVHAQVARLVWAAVAPLPALLLVALVHRRDWIADATARHAWLPRSRAPRREPHESRGFREAMQAGLVAGTGVLVVLLALVVAKAETFRLLGSAAVMMLFLALAVQVLTTVLLLTRRMGSHVGGFGAALVVLLVLYLAVGPGSEPLGDEQLPDPAAPPATAALAPPAASAPISAPISAMGTPLPPAVLVNARGGGLRAALFTADVLARLDDRSCGAFGRQLGGLSGVSGGSLGLAIYLVARQAHVQDGGWHTAPCPLAGADAVPGPLTQKVRQALLLDHLSPVLGRMATRDLFPRTAPTRGQALLDSWNAALLAQTGGRAALSLAMPLDQLNGGLPTPVQAPVPVYFNATDADSGGIVWFSNVPGQPMGLLRPGGGTGAAGAAPGEAPALSVGQAVLHSARFPIVSPAGRVRHAALCSVVETPWWADLPGLGDRAEGTRICRLVDGGYADNSGVTTLRHLLAEPARSLLRLDLDGNPPPNGSASGPSHLPTLLGALLRARSAQADRAAGDDPAASPRTACAAGATTASMRLRLAPVQAGAVTAPLGWSLGDAAAAGLHDAAAAAVECVCERRPGLCKPA